MAVPNLLKAVLHWSGHGEEGAISFWYAGAAGGLTPTQLNTAAVAMRDAALADSSPPSFTLMRQLLDNAQTLDKLSLYQYATAPGPATSQGEETLALGGIGSLNAPLQVALVASLRTDSPGARHRGRLYMPGHCLSIQGPGALATQISAALVADTAIGLAEAFRTGLQSSLADNTITWVVFSPTGGLITDITSVRVDNKFDTQRRREASLKPTATETRSNGL